MHSSDPLANVPITLDLLIQMLCTILPLLPQLIICFGQLYYSPSSPSFGSQISFRLQPSRLIHYEISQDLISAFSHLLHWSQYTSQGHCNFGNANFPFLLRGFLVDHIVLSQPYPFFCTFSGSNSIPFGNPHLYIC